jgi:mRNA interferase RelE/StbE
MYELSYSKKVLSQLKKLELTEKDRMIKSLEKIRIRPHHFVKRLVGTEHYALRVGDYRIILDIVNRKLIIYVLEVGHRKKIYKG